MSLKYLFEIVEVIDFEYEYIAAHSAYVQFSDHNGRTFINSCNKSVWQQILRILDFNKEPIYYFLIWRRKIIGVLSKHQIENVLIDRGADNDVFKKFSR